MKSTVPTRTAAPRTRSCALAALVSLGLFLPVPANAEPHIGHQPPGAAHPTRPAPVERRPNGIAAQNRQVFQGQHLAQWMSAHSALSLTDQQRALDQEPGFRNLPTDDQQRLHQRLAQLNKMSPEQQQRLLQRIEAMERLSPPQRQQVRDAMAQLGSLPEYRRPLVSRTFYFLRDMPLQQRYAYMNSPQFQAQFNEQERATLNGLLSIAPIYPPLQGPPAAPRYPAPAPAVPRY